MTSRVPQLLVTLTPEGKLAIELPGIAATRRKIEIRESEAGATLLRILNAQAREVTEIGLDGAPTAKQVLHWERHNIWPDSRCRFCLAEGRIKPDYKRVQTKKLVERRPDGVEIRRFTEKGKIMLNMEDLEIEI